MPFNRTYYLFNPDPVTGPDTNVLASGGLAPNPGPGPAPVTDPTPLDIHDATQFIGDGSAAAPTTIVNLDEGQYV
jgi:hypothetical protein